MSQQIHLPDEVKKMLMEYSSPNSDITHMLSAFEEKREAESKDQSKIDKRRFIVTTILSAIAAITSIISAVFCILTYFS